MSSRPTASSAFQETERGLSIQIRLTPRGARDAFEGVIHLDNGAEVVKATVRAAPQNGDANDALIRLAARAFGVAPSRVVLEKGASSRLKTILIEDAALAMADILTNPGKAAKR